MQRRAAEVTLVLLSTTLWGLLLPTASWAETPAPAQPNGWDEQIQQENERERKAYEALNEQIKREALEREHMKMYQQGQENLRQQNNLRRYQSIQGNR